MKEVILLLLKNGADVTATEFERKKVDRISSSRNNEDIERCSGTKLFKYTEIEGKVCSNSLACWI